MNTLPIVLPADPLVGCIPSPGTAPPGEESGLFAGALAEAMARLTAQMNVPDGEPLLSAFLSGGCLPAVSVTTARTDCVAESTDASPTPEDTADGNSSATEKPAGEERLNWTGLAALLALAQVASPGRLPAAVATEPGWAVKGEKAEEPQDGVAMVAPAVGKPSGETTHADGDGIRLALPLRQAPLVFTATQAAYIVPRPIPATVAEGVLPERVTAGSGEGEQTIAPGSAVPAVQPNHSSKPIDDVTGAGRNGNAPEVGQAELSPLSSGTGQLSPQVGPDYTEADTVAVRSMTERQPHHAPEQRDVGRMDTARLSSSVAFAMSENAGETGDPRQSPDGQMDAQMPAEIAEPVSTGTKPHGAQMQHRTDLWARFSEQTGVSQAGMTPKTEQRQSTAPAEPDNSWQPGTATEGPMWPFREAWEWFGVRASASEKPMPGAVRATSPELTEASLGAMRVALPRVAEAYLLMATEEATPQGSPLRYATAQGLSPERQGGQAQWSVGHETASIANATSAMISMATPEAREGLTSASVEIQPVADRLWLRAFSWAGEKDMIPAAVSRYLVERLTQAVRRGEQQCRLELYPKELGRVDAHLSFTEERLSVYLGVETVQAHRAVQQALPELRFALEARGLPVEQCYVGLLGGGTTSGQGFDQPRGQAGIPYFVPHHKGEAGDVSLQQARAITPAKPQGLVDLVI